MNILKKISSLTFYDLISKLKSLFTDINSSIGILEDSINNISEDVSSLINTPPDTRNYKILSFIISGTLAGNPVTHIVENTIGEIQFVKGGTGILYVISPNNIFQPNRTAVVTTGRTTQTGASTFETVQVKYGNNIGEVDIFTKVNNVLTDDIFYNDFVEIRVYNQ